MSNPAVIKLQSGKIGKSKVWLDDNFGESVHIHIDDMRIDLTTNEFKKLYTDLCDTLNALVDVEGCDIHDIDPVYLQVLLWRYLPKLVGVSIDKVKLGDMLAPRGEKIHRLPESDGVKALEGLSNENEGYRKSHHIGQTDGERMQDSLDSIKANGYPFNNQYIIMYGDDNIIRDGQHRASCLYHLYGNIEVPVMRLKIKGYKSPNIHKNYNNCILCLYRKCRQTLPSKIKHFSIKRVCADFKKTAKSVLKGRKEYTDTKVLNIFKAK
ncbi:MAG: hypothetical protein IK057_02415 [Clostridia bacterium]|nr:hypothetical protein [Clostridia bacterium]